MKRPYLATVVPPLIGKIHNIVETADMVARIVAVFAVAYFLIRATRKINSSVLKITITVIIIIAALAVLWLWFYWPTFFRSDAIPVHPINY